MIDLTFLAGISTQAEAVAMANVARRRALLRDGSAPRLAIVNGRANYFRVMPLQEVPTGKKILKVI